MAACERCWAEYRGLQATGVFSVSYEEILAYRHPPCTPEEQCGDLHILCVDNNTRCRCGKVVAAVTSRTPEEPR